MIALIGTHGVGKTTLLNSLALRGSNYIVKDGDSRIVKAFDKEIGGKLTARDQQILINRISDNKWDLETRISNLFTTRTPLDHYAYCKALGWDDLAERRNNLFTSTPRPDVKFFYIPIEFGLISDGIRFEGESFQREIDEILLERIDYHGLSPITLTGTVEERLETLLKNI